MFFIGVEKAQLSHWTHTQCQVMGSRLFGHERGQELMGIKATSDRNTIPRIVQQLSCVIVPREANSAGKLRRDFEAMVKRRHQDPKPKTEKLAFTMIFHNAMLWAAHQ